MLRQVLLSNLILGVQYAVGGLIPLILVPHIVRSVGLGPYGDLAIALSCANYGAITVQFAFQLTGPKGIAQLPQGRSLRVPFADITVAKLLLLVPVSVALALAAIFLPDSASKLGQWVILALLPLGAALHSGWYLQAAGRFLSVCVISIIGGCTALLIGLTMVRGSNPEGFFGAGLALGIGSLIAGVGTLAMSVWALRSAPPRDGPLAPLTALREGWPLFASQFTAAFYSASGPLLIRLMSGAEEAGAFSAVERTVGAVLGACLLTHTAAYPRLASLYLTDRPAYVRLVRFVVLSYLVCASCVVLAVLTNEAIVLRYLFGAAPKGARALVGWSLLWLLTGVFGAALTGFWTVSGRQRLVWPLTMKVLCTAIIVGLPATYLFGAWAWMAALVISQVPVLRAATAAWREETESQRT